MSVDLSLGVLMETILGTILSIHSAINFKIHTLASVTKCVDLGVPQVVSSTDLECSDRFFDSMEFRCETEQFAKTEANLIW